MEDVNISKFRAQVVRAGSTPASPGFVVSEGQNPVDPSGSGQTHLPVTIATASTGLSITESQILSGAGLVSQYIRGDGSLADFPATTGGGSSVSYYLNGSVSQGTIGGVAYKELNRAPVFGAGTDITINADGYIASFITDAGDPNKLLIPAGNWNLETYFSASSNGGSPSFYVELYKYNGTTFTLIASSSSAPELIAFGTNLNPYYSTLAVPETVLALTDRLALRYYVTHSGRTITLHTENNHLCQVITTFTTGLTALNGLTSQVQYLTVGTSGTDFAISSATDTHTFNLPTASATNRGALSSADWTTFNNKTSNLGTVTSVGLSSATSGVTIGSTPVTTSGTITLAIATASGSQNGLLSSTDWTTFNSKQNALTNPVTGTGTSGQVAYFTGTSAISSESSLLWDATNDRLGIGVSPTQILHLYGTSIRPQIESTGNGGYTSLRFVGKNSAGTARTFEIGLNITADDVWQITNGSSSFVAVSTGGNLLVNTTTDAGFKLDVNGTGRFSGQLTLTYNSSAIDAMIFQDTRPTSGSGTWRIGAGTGGVGFGIYSNSLGATPFFLSASTGAATFSSTIRSNDTNGLALGSIAGYRRIQYGSDNATSFSLLTDTNSYAGLYAGAATFSSSVTATSETTDSSMIQQWGYNSNSSAYRLRLNTIVSSGLVKYSFDSINNSTAYNNNLVLDRGNVGIGTTSPSTKFVVSNAGAGGIEMQGNSSVSGGAFLQTYNRSTNAFFDFDIVANNIIFRTGQSYNPSATITSSGNVLIGTATNGASKLRIVGLPTSSAGLSSGDVWSDSGTLKIA